ncbi:MAG: dihydrofolate reductase family protein [Alphaproteobacteria bacterium]
MPKLVLKMQMSLDGFAARLDGDVGFIFTSMDEALTYWIVQDIWKAGLHIMGRRTYEDMAAWWPKSSEPFAAPMNMIPKAVFSDTLEEAHWGPVTVIRGDLAAGIAHVKTQSDKDIYAHGGAGFARALVAADLVDEYHLITHPVVLGRGLAVFSGGGARDLELVESKSFPGGAIASIYRPAKETR